MSEASNGIGVTRYADAQRPAVVPGSAAASGRYAAGRSVRPMAVLLAMSNVKRSNGLTRRLIEWPRNSWGLLLVQRVSQSSSRP
jgi:hypothetical protein